MNKTFACLLSSLTLCASLPLAAQELAALPRLSGRVQYEKNPGQGAGSMKFIDSPLPQQDVRVGPTRQEGVALGYLIAFHTTPEFRQRLAAADRMELMLEVLGTTRDGAPDDLVVALLDMGSGDDLSAYVHFGAWNNARDLTPVGRVDADPDKGIVLIDLTRPLANAKRQPGGDTPVIWFAVYLPAASIEGPEGRHVIFGGEPKLIARPRQ